MISISSARRTANARRKTRALSKKLLRCGLTSTCSCSASCRSSSSCRGPSFLGTSMFTSTIKSPTPRPCGLGNPLPRMDTSPDCVPVGTRGARACRRAWAPQSWRWRGLQIGNRHPHDQVLPFALKQVVFADRDEAVAIAARTARGTGLALARQSHAIWSSMPAGVWTSRRILCNT